MNKDGEFSILYVVFNSKDSNDNGVKVWLFINMIFSNKINWFLKGR